jgi:hypothetical protein
LFEDWRCTDESAFYSNTGQGFEKMNQALKIRSEVLANRSY